MVSVVRLPARGADGHCLVECYEILCPWWTLAPAYRKCQESLAAAGRGGDNPVVADDEFPFCVECGTRLDAGDRFCARCGTARWAPPAPAAVPAGGAGGAPAVGGGPVSLGMLPWAYACGAVLAL